VRVRVAAGAGLALVALVLAVTLAQQNERRTESNAIVQASGVALRVPLSRPRCQPTVVPRDTSRVRLFGEAGGGGTLISVRLSAAGERLLNRTAYVRGEEQVEVSLGRVLDRERRGARLCIRNMGPASVRFAGNRTPVLGPANPVGGRLDDDIRVDYLADGESSWWSMASVIADRFPLLKASFFGPWTLWAVLALVLLSALLALRILMRSLRE